MKTISLLAVLALACAGAVPASTVAPDNEGDAAVVARVVINGEDEVRQHVANVPGYYTALHLASVADPEREVRLPVVPRVAVDAAAVAVYGARIPAGRYRVVGLAQPQGGYAAYWLAKEAFPEIDVAPGHVVDLGTLVLQPTGPGRGIAVQWPGDDAFDAADRALVAEVTRLGADAPVDRWAGRDGWTYREDAVIEGGTVAVKLLGDDAQPDVVWGGWPRTATFDDTIARIRGATASIGEAGESDDAAYFGSNLGQILRRGRDGTWSTLDTGLAVPIATVVAAPGHLYAAARDGRLLDSTDGGATWRVGDARIPGGAARALRLDDGRFVLVSAGLAGSDAVLYRGADFLQLAHTTPIALPKYWRENAVVRPISLVASAGRAIVGLPPDDLAVVDLASGAVSTPKVKNLGELAASADGAVVYSRTSWSDNTGVVSVDGGATWRNFKWGGSVFSQGVGFRDARRALGVHGKAGWSAVKYFAVTSDDGGQHWERVADAPACNLFRWLPKAGVGLCQTGDGTVSSTVDGTTWTPERTFR